MLSGYHQHNYFSNFSLLYRIFFIKDCSVQVGGNPNSHPDLWEALWSDSATCSNPIFYPFSSILIIFRSNHTGLVIPQINQVHLSWGPLLLFTRPKTIVVMVWLCMGPRSTWCHFPRRSFLANQELTPTQCYFLHYTPHYLKVGSWFVYLFLVCLSSPMRWVPQQ